MVRHVLCSKSEDDRDEWINALLFYVVLDPEPSSAPPVEKASRGKRLQRHKSQDDSDPPSQTTSSDNLPAEAETIGIRYDQMPQGKRPTMGTGEVNRQSTFSSLSYDEIPRVEVRRTRTPEPRYPGAAPNVPSRSPYRAPISGPMNGAPITDDAVWSSAQREEERRREEKRAKKKSVWGFLNKGRATPESIQPSAPPPPALLQHGLFGIPLRDAVDITREMGMGINVPSVIYRCVEYLEHMDAAKEEGIYRLSGSNSAIRLLKDRFNSGYPLWSY
jgi:RalA-binding protein 1